MRLLSCIAIVAVLAVSNQTTNDIPKWKSLLDEAKGLYDSREYENALNVANAALKEAQAEHGDVHKSVALVKHRIATIHQNMENPNTEKFYLEAVETWRALPNPEPVEMAKTLSSFGNYYQTRIRYGPAERYLLEALDLKRKHLPPDDPSTGMTLQALGNLYDDMGDYLRAEEFTLAALELRRRCNPFDAGRYVASLNSAAILYANEKRFAEAERLLQEGRDLLKQEGHIDVWITATNTLAWICLTTDLAKSEVLSLRVLAVLDSMPKPYPRLRVDALLNLGIAYAKTNRLADALACHIESDSLTRAVLGQDYYGYERLASMYQLAEDRRLLKNFETADSLYRFVLSENDRQYGELHPQIGYTLEGLIHLCLDTRSHERGLGYAERLFRVWDRDLTNAMLVLSESDAISKAARRSAAAGAFYSFYFSDSKPGDELERKAADIALITKGRISDEVFYRERTRELLRDPNVEELANALKDVKLSLSDLYVKGPGDLSKRKFRVRADSLDHAAKGLESKLATHSAHLIGQLSSAEVNVQAVATHLPDDCALVEYIRLVLPEASGDSTRGVPHYLAVVLNRGRRPGVYDLGPAEAIDNLVAAYREHLLEVSTLEHPPLESQGLEYAGIATSIYDAVMRPVEASLGKSAMILFAPDGALNLVSFAGLIDPDGKYVVEKRPVAYLSAGRDLLRLRHPGKGGLGALAMGDPDFDASIALRWRQEEGLRVASAGSEGSNLRNVRPRCPDIWNEAVRAVPGTRDEVDRVTSIWEQSPMTPVRRFVGAAASEDNFKKLAPGCRMVHIATHGYFREKYCETAGAGKSGDALDENPLLRSGFFLAGANLHGAGADDAGCEDGIVTAYEISTMDFEGAEIVVLSACETALGDVQEAEGTYGLRRAFQMAGARTVVSALWPVSDETSAAMMSEIYSRSNVPLVDRIRDVQLEQIRELRRNGLSDHPQNWAGFIVTGDWR